MKNAYEIDGDDALIYMRKGELACGIDAADLPLVDAFPGTWGATPVMSGTRYARAQPLWGHPGGQMHRVIMGARTGEVVDHINHDGLDNRRANLRIVTIAQNLQNRRQANRQSKSGIRGVYWHKKAGKWMVSVAVNRRSHYLGLFEDVTDAEAAAIAGRARLMTHSTN